MNSIAILGTRGYPSYYGGFETLIRELAPYLANEGWDVTVYGRHGATAPHDPNKDPRVHTRTTRGLETKSLSTLSYGLTSSFHAAFKKPDIALLMNVANGYWLPMLKARGIPTVMNVDGIEWERAKWGNSAKSVFKTGAKLSARFADTLVFDSQALEFRWKNEFDRSGVFIPYGAHDHPALPLKDDLEPKSYALMVARFVPENTVGEFLDAAEIISDNIPVVIVGSSGYGGPLDAKAKQLSEQHSNIRWLGHISDDDRLHALWQNAGAYFHGHTVGGTNPALIQAMSCGAPIIARDTVYNREVLGDNGLFVSSSPPEIALALEDLISNPARRSELSEHALRRQKNHYTWQSVCAGYAHTIEHTLKTSNDGKI